MDVVEIKPEEAKRLLDQEPPAFYLDVRTVPEFNAGHTPNAMNIPVAEVNGMTGRMELNPKFLSTVEGNLSKDASIICGCKSGQRSFAAAKMMLEAGYTNVRSVHGGFGGVTDYSGQVMEDGWLTLGYPIEHGEGSERSYASLTKKIRQ